MPKFAFFFQSWDFLTRVSYVYRNHEKNILLTLFHTVKQSETKTKKYDKIELAFFTFF